MLAFAGLLLIETATVALTHDVPYRSGAAAFGRWLVLLLAGYVAASAHSRRWWATPLATASGALAAEVLACVVGVVTGQFLARGFGPGIVLVIPIWAVLGGLTAGLTAAAARTLVERRATAV